MYRSFLIAALGLVLAAVAGCRCCSDPPPTCPTSNAGGACRLTGNAKPISDNCYDAITGAPVPCPPPGVGMVIPGGYQPGPVPQAMPPGNELPPPGETIPPANIPNAQPVPAPGFGSTIPPGWSQPTKLTPTR